eukprot:4106867-Amphidinium_carterae.3
MGDHTTTNQQWTKRHQVQVLWQRIFTIHPQHGHTNICSNTKLLLTIAILKQFTVFTTDMAKWCPQHPTRQ